MVSAYRAIYLTSSALLFGAALLALLSLALFWFGIASEVLHPFELAVQVVLVVTYAGLGPRLVASRQSLAVGALVLLIVAQLFGRGGGLDGAVAIAPGPAAMLALLAFGALMFVRGHGVLAQMLVMASVLLALMVVLAEVFDVPTVQMPIQFCPPDRG